MINVDGFVIDYTPADECLNKKVWYTCIKCGMCGRKFEHGFLVDDGGTHVTDEDDSEDNDNVIVIEDNSWGIWQHDE